MASVNGCVYWVTGLSGAGKTTLSQSLSALFQTKNQPVVVLDGDELRNVLTGPDASGYHRDDRLALGYRYARLARYLADQDITVIVATISMFDEIYQWNRTNIAQYIEIFLDVPLEELQRRDSKFVYSSSSPGSADVAGIGFPIDKPTNPEIRLEWHHGDTPEATFDRLYEHLEALETDNK